MYIVKMIHYSDQTMTYIWNMLHHNSYPLRDICIYHRYILMTIIYTVENPTYIPFTSTNFIANDPVRSSCHVTDDIPRMNCVIMGHPRKRRRQKECGPVFFFGYNRKKPESVCVWEIMPARTESHTNTHTLHKNTSINGGDISFSAQNYAHVFHREQYICIKNPHVNHRTTTWRAGKRQAHVPRVSIINFGIRWECKR